MSTINTKWFTSGMAGAPVLSGSAGAMIAVLDACLKDGFNLLTLDSLVVASNVATGTKASHGYLANQVITIAGASPSSLNGDWRVITVTTNTFTFTTAGISDQTATGTITSKTSHCDWEKQFSGTNLAVYRSGDVLSSRQCIKVDDTVGQYATVRGAEGFTDISTEVNGFATHYFKKSNATDSNARAWLVVADAKTAYLGVQWSNSGAYDFYSFGDFYSTVAGDAANFRLQGLLNSSPGTLGQYSSCNAAYCYAPYQSVASRAYSQIFGAIDIHQGSLVSISQIGSGTSYASYGWALSGNHGQGSNANYPPWSTPALSDNGYHFSPVYLFEVTASGLSIRGVARGILHLLENLPIASWYSIQTGVENVDGGLVLMARSAGQVTTAAGPAYQYPAAVLAFKLGAF